MSGVRTLGFFRRLAVAVTVCGLFIAPMPSSGAHQPEGTNQPNVAELRASAEQGDAGAQFALGRCYYLGNGVEQNYAEAFKWYHRAAEQGLAKAQVQTGVCYDAGIGVVKNHITAVRWYSEAAEQGCVDAQSALGVCYALGRGVERDPVQAYAWFDLAAMQGDQDAASFCERWVSILTPEQIANAKRVSRELTERIRKKQSLKDTRIFKDPVIIAGSPDEHPDATGSGFFISSEGYFVSCYHVIKNASRIRVHVLSAIYPATIVRTDEANDLALLKVHGVENAVHLRLAPVPARMGDRVATVGFPDPAVMGLSPKFSTGHVAALAGPGDSPRLMQVSLPLQPGNSGGPLLDASGNVVGVVVAQLDKIAMLAREGILPENVNYAVKGTILAALLDSVPELARQSPPRAETKPLTDADIARLAEPACGLVLVER